MLTLLYTRDGQICRHELTPGDTIVGRASICDLTIEDPSISRRHARFRIHGDRCVLTDLGGRNGTFLNGEQVTEAQVRPGDAIVLGRFPLRVETYQAPSTILSDEHSLIETDRTVVRRVDDDTETRAGVQPAAHAERLLLLLTEIARQLVRWQPLPEILDRIAAVVFDTIAVERAFILLVDEETGEIVPRVARSRSGDVESHASLSRTIIRRVIEERVAILAGDVRLESRFAALQSVQDAQIRSFMCTPLWNQSRVIGVVYVDNPHTAQLTAADLDVLQALSSYAAVAIEQARLSDQILQETRRREALQRYHPAAVVERILAKGIGADAPFMAEERDVTVLFADIVGFTARAERMTPSAVAHLLNQCLGVMCDAVFAEEGTLDKFIGDAVLAVFGAPLAQEDHAARALRVAAAMRQAVASLDLQPPIVLRIAVNSGVATVGDIGSPKRREYTVLGDVVNTCARIVTYACEPGQIVMTAATRERLAAAEGIRSVGTVALRGRDAAVDLFALEETAPTQKE